MEMTPGKEVKMQIQFAEEMFVDPPSLTETERRLYGELREMIGIAKGLMMALELRANPEEEDSE